MTKLKKWIKDKVKKADKKPEKDSPVKTPNYCGFVKKAKGKIDED